MPSKPTVFTNFNPTLPSFRVAILFPVLVFLGVMAFPTHAGAKVDLTTLSGQNSVQTTIYKAEDLTLVRDSRTFQFAKGLNRIQFSWANTRIDPTSLSLEIRDPSLPVTIRELAFPPNARELGIWHIQADEACQADLDITYFTSGISWEAFYMAFLSRDQSRLDLKGYVRVDNQSGEDYANARTRLVVGRIHLLDRIAELAARPYPYGQPEIGLFDEVRQEAFAEGRTLFKAPPAMRAAGAAPPPSPKEVAKESLSEYFLYTIEGTETIPHGWAKRLRSFEAGGIPVKNRYVYEPDRYGKGVNHMLTFKNEAEDSGASGYKGLGQTPLPGGEFKVFQRLDTDGGLIFMGSDRSKYIPLSKEVRLNLGKTTRVTIDPRVMSFKKANLTFDKKGNLSGFDEIRKIIVDTANFTKAPALVEIVENLETKAFTVTDVTCSGTYEKIDLDSFKFLITLAPGAREKIEYTLTTFKGERKWQHASE